MVFCQFDHGSGLCSQVWWFDSEGALEARDIHSENSCLQKIHGSDYRRCGYIQPICSHPILLCRQVDGCLANAIMRGLPCPLQRGHCTSRSAMRTEASGSRGFTRKSKSTTVPQLSQLMISH